MEKNPHYFQWQARSELVVIEFFRDFTQKAKGMEEITLSLKQTRGGKYQSAWVREIKAM